MTARCLVVSAVNFTEGGPLTILKEFVTAACEMLPRQWSIVVFVHDRRLLDLTRPRFIEIPAAKRSWLRRMCVEWLEFARYARELKPDLWVSLHDMTPRIGAIRQAVYCHNPMPFYRLRLFDIWLEPRVILFRMLYEFIYRINLRRNYAVVVQQSWLRDEFRKWVGADNRIIVSHPEVQRSTPEASAQRPPRVAGQGARFVYPALPRVFKNVELIGRAVQQLEATGQWRSEVTLTIDGGENRYARWLKHRFGNLRTLRFAGRQSAPQMRSLYAAADCLLFPSRLETWGLPITEAKLQRLPMLVADLPYARETVGDYDRAQFLAVQDPALWATTMLAVQQEAGGFEGCQQQLPGKPYAANWRQLLLLLTDGLLSEAPLPEVQGSYDNE